jgi:hypothetical protein
MSGTNIIQPITANMETKHTSRTWQIIEHNWQETSIVVGDKTICVLSLPEGDDEDNLGSAKVDQIFYAELIASAPDLLYENATLKKEKDELVNILERIGISLYNHPDCIENSEFRDYVITINELIQKHQK